MAMTPPSLGRRALTLPLVFALCVACSKTERNATPTPSNTQPAAAPLTAPPITALPARSAEPAWTPPVALPPVVTDSALPMYSTVTLPKLGVQMEVPSELAAKHGPNRVSTVGGEASITYAELPPTRGIDEIFTEMTTEDPKSTRSIVYKRKKNGWFVLSGYDGANIFYDKIVKLGDRNLSFSLVYPAKQKADYEADTAYMADSFRAIGTPAPRPPTGLCRNSGDCTPGYHCTPGGFCIINY